VITNEDRQLAGQAWCDPETSEIEMDVRLAEAFARRIAQLRAEVERLTKDRDEWKAASEAWSERAHAGWQKRAEAAEKALEAGKVMTPAMLDSVSEGDLRILYAWAAGRQGEVERAKAARNAAEAKAAQFEQDWVAAKHDFGVSMGKAREQTRAAEAEVEKLTRAVYLFTENTDNAAGKSNALSFALLKRAEAAEAEVARWKESHAANVDVILSHASLVQHHKARADAAEAELERLRHVAEVARKYGNPDPACTCIWNGTGDTAKPCPHRQLAAALEAKP
jgi:hypothetical protein